MKLALIFVIVASLLVAASFAEPECFDCEKPVHHEECKSCQKEKNCCNPVPGRDGRDGFNGFNGMDGFNGENGADGMNGTNGIDAPNAEAEYAQVYGVQAQTAAVGTPLFFEFSGLLSSGMTHQPGFNVAGSTVTVTRAGVYRITLIINPASTTTATFATCAVAVGGVALTGAQNSFVAAGAGATDFLNVDVQLSAGAVVSILVTAGPLTIPAMTGTVPNLSMTVVSLSLA